jgi:hypothetical protein
LSGEPGELVSPRQLRGETNDVCHAAATIVRGTTSEAFWSGSWRDRFGPVEWSQGSYSTVTSDAQEHDVPFKYTSIDIDNDGAPDVVLMLSDLMFSTLWDWLYVFTPRQFDDAQNGRTFVKLLQSAPTLNPRNVVQFYNGETGAPVELHIWRFKKTRYLLLKENSFAKGEGGPSSLFVAKLTPASKKWDASLKVNRLVPELICQMVTK